MKPLHLALNNFAGILSGQGKQQITLDLEKVVPHDAQIVAIAGPNGSGKTTIMDNLHPYRVMPSRANSPTPSSFSFYEHIAGGEGNKELLWEHMGVRYQSEIRFRSTAKTKKTEAYLYVINENGHKTPWTDPRTGAQSDGKADTYDKAIEAILGKPEVFFQAQFSAQGKEPIGSMSASDVKRLIADMIGANRSSELSGKAAEVVKALKPRLAGLQDEISRTEARIPSESDLATRIESAKLQISDGQARTVDLTNKINELAVRIASAGQNAAQMEAARAQHAAFNAQLQQASQENQAANKQIEDQRSAAAVSAYQALNAAKQTSNVCATVVSNLRAEIARNESLAAKADEVTQASAKLDVHKANRQVQQAALDALIPELLKMERVQIQTSEMASELASVQKDGEHLVKALAAAKATAALLSEVPCQGTDLSGQCKLLSQSNQAASKIPETEVNLQTVRAGYQRVNTERRKMLATLEELKACAQQAEVIKAQLAQIEVDIQRSLNTVSMADQVNAALSALPSLSVQLTMALADVDRAQQSLVESQAQVDGLNSRFDQMLFEQKSRHAERIQGLERMRMSLPPLTQGDDVDELAKAQKQVQDQLKQAEAVQATSIQHLANLQAQAEQAVLSRVQVADQRKRCEALSQEIAHWLLLSKALGTDGIIAMSIDDAGPAISSIANALLEDCYGGRFALSLVTQKETQAGIAKETFRIEVEDNERGERKFLESMSGGEKVWINECLVRAIALYMAQVADARSQTLFSDESDGPLDPKRKRQYMGMKRAVIERGGYDREYLITQTPELLEMCDAVINVETL